jgi:hypothetical protein
LEAIVLLFSDAPHVEDQPHTTLSHWRVFKVLATGDRHLAGCALETGRGRVSTPLADLDVHQLRATTRSGRVYQLKGEPDKSCTAEYLWSWWSLSMSVGRWRDTTEDVLAAHRQSLH